MTRERAKLLLPILTAWAEGRTIQYRIAGDTDWFSIDNPSFSEEPECYRVAPSPREFFVPACCDNTTKVASAYGSPEIAREYGWAGKLIKVREVND